MAFERPDPHQLTDFGKFVAPIEAALDHHMPRPWEVSPGNNYVDEPFPRFKNFRLLTGAIRYPLLIVIGNDHFHCQC